MAIFKFYPDGHGFKRVYVTAATKVDLLAMSEELFALYVAAEVAPYACGAEELAEDTAVACLTFMWGIRDAVEAPLAFIDTHY